MNEKPKWIVGTKDTPAGAIPIVSSKLDWNDKLGGMKVRWGFQRMHYTVNPGIYGIGNPDESSPVFVTANYKKTFDILRKDLEGIDGWILVLDTKGVNVWCAAGKGTFGTAETVKRFFLSKVDLLVNHKTLILPQLGAVGVSSIEVKSQTGFKVVYGPVRSSDIKEFVANNFQKTDEMKRVKFTFIDRLVLTPMELVSFPLLILLFFIVSGILSVTANKLFDLKIITDFLPYLGAFVTGSVLFPLLIPYIPFRSFALKGMVLGFAYAFIASISSHFSIPEIISGSLIMPVIVSFLALNFTGATTFTSMTGAKLEVKYSLPVYVVMFVIGAGVKIFSTVQSFLS
jgi:hypothetical protein